MVTEHQPWSERMAAWLPGAVERGVPLLGICYGHQLLAYALGGEVGDNPNGREFGTVEIELRDEAYGDALLGGLTSPIQVQVSHIQSVLRLPEGAGLLASSRQDWNQAFVVGGCAWGGQFHPEFDAEIARAYIRHHRADLASEGRDVDCLLEGCYDTPWGSEILKRFVEIVQGRPGSHQIGQRESPGIIGPEGRSRNEGERMCAL